MKNLKKLLSLVLALVMCLSLVNLSAFAVEGAEPALEELVAALPEEVTEENAESVKAQLEAILTALAADESGEDPLDDATMSRLEQMRADVDAVLNPDNKPGNPDTMPEQEDENTDGDESENESANAPATVSDPPVADPVAKIGETGYATLQEAVNAAQSGDTVEVLNDIVLDTYLEVKQQVTLDLGGFKISRNPSKGLTQLIRVNGGGTLTVQDSSVTGTGKIENAKFSSNNKNYGTAVAVINGSLTVESGKITGYMGVVATSPDSSVTASGGMVEGTQHGMYLANGASATVKENADISATETASGYGIFLWGPGGESTEAPTTLTMEGGSVHTTKNAAISGNGSVETGNDARHTKITITGGTITSTESWGIYHPQVGELTITGGTITGITGIEMRAGTLNVSGNPEITATGTYSESANGNGATTIGVGIAVSQHTTERPITVNIDGGTITGPRALVEHDLQNDNPASDGVSVNIGNGTFISTGTGNDNIPVVSQNLTNFITGGTFSNDVSMDAEGEPTDYVAEPYACHLLEEGGQWWNVHHPGSKKGSCDECDSLTYGLYVSATGNDEAAGTREAPFATLAHAVSVAPDGATIYVLSDLTMTECARFYNKHLTIKGVGETDEEAVQWTVTRGELDLQSDPRTWYNPAMIEVQTTSASAGLTLESIILDDAGKHPGTVFAQAPTPTDGNGAAQYVQDAIIASNATEPTTITLSDGVVLRNFGGMSAVRVTNKAKVVMESGSKIEDTLNQTREKGQAGSNGPAGAVWIQGGELVMNEGSEITGVNGRAVYIDGGNATINGTISNITANNNMWQGQSGVAIHVRNTGSTATLGSTGKISGISGAGDVIAMVASAKSFIAAEGSEIFNVNGPELMNSSSGMSELNGYVHDITTTDEQIVKIWTSTVTLGITGKIENCKCKNVGVLRPLNGGYVHVYGEIGKSNVSGIYLSSQGNGALAYAYIYEGAYIHDQSSYGVYINNNGQLRMTGGEISNNSTGVYARSKSGFTEALFEMSGGKIINNRSTGISYLTAGGKNSHVNITGGEISGNGGSYQISISGANASDNVDRLQLAPGVVQAANGKAAAISTSFGTLTLDANYADIYLGNAKSAASDQIKTLAGKYGTEGAYTTAGSYALWFKPTTETLHFTASRSSSVNPSNYLKVGYIPLKADGTPADNATLTVLDVDNTDPVDVNLKGLTVDQPYALMWVVPDENNTGSLKLTGTASVSEEKDRAEPYQVDYTFTYGPKNLYSSVAVGDTFTATVTLDPELTYVVDSLKVTSSYWEQVGETQYNAETHTVTLTLKVAKKFYSFTSVTFTLSATFDGTIFDTVEQLESDAAIVGTLSSGTQINLKTALPTVTKLVPLGSFAVTFDSAGGSAVETQVIKDGETATEPADPTRSGYTFNGWFNGETEYDFDTPVTGNITLTARWTQISGGGTYTPPTTDIGDDTPPLANVDGLNDTDHFAYIAGYPDGTVRPEANITRAEAATIFFRLMTEEFRVANWSTTNGFTDTDADAWYNAAVSTAAKAGILKGYPDGTFKPNDPITRAEFATMAARFMTDDVTDDVGDFEDTGDHWAAKDIRRAVNAGWIKGVGDNRFDPEASITRAQVVTMVNRMLDRNLVPDAEHMLDTMKTWPDNMDTSKWYYLDIQEAGNGHNYERGENNEETWTELVPTDWAAKEAEWIANNGASAKTEDK